MTKYRIIYFFLLLVGLNSQAQTPDTTWALVIDSGSTFRLEGLSFADMLSVQKDLILERDISGSGIIRLNGTAAQTMYVPGARTIPGLKIDNPAHVDVDTAGTGSLTVVQNFELLRGRLDITDRDLILESGLSLLGGDATSFVATSGAGQLIRRFSSAIQEPAALFLPVGTSTGYRPAFFSVPSGTFQSPQIGVRCVTGNPANLPVRLRSFIRASWPITLQGVSGNAVPRIRVQYQNSDVTGTEADIEGYVYQGTSWSTANSTRDLSLNQLSATVQNGQTITGMNRFVSVGARAFLEGPYDASAGLMRDDLRTNNPFTPNSLIPTSDPYRSRAGFTHVNNPAVETISNTVFANNVFQPNRTVVDWVFLELRRPFVTGASNIVGTRSALLLRNGTIVDVDGASPVTFNNVAAGEYALTIRHRNHLGISMDPAEPNTFSEDQQAATGVQLFDSRTATNSKLFGDGLAYATASHPTLGTVNLLRSGNINGDDRVRFSGPGNDQAPLLQAVSGNPQTVLVEQYSDADVNMNRQVSMTGPNNDRDALFVRALSSNIFRIFHAQIPN